MVLWPGRTLFKLLQHGFLEIVRGRPLEEQTLSQCTVIERSENVLVIREPIQAECCIEFCLKIIVLFTLLALAHRPVEILGDHLSGFVAARFEGSLEGITECITELLVRDSPRRGTVSLRSLRRRRYRWGRHYPERVRVQITYLVDKSSGNSLISECLEVQKALNHVIVVFDILDDVTDNSLEKHNQHMRLQLLTLPNLHM